ncbi:hypothetical protein ACWGB8_08330 [Kitasatospora sp. NPDC054939]
MSTTEMNERLLDAGAVLPAGTLAGAGRPDSPADVLTARSYHHPVLGERRIVRLVPRALGPAEDLAVDFLGLAPATEPVEVGQVRQEALGFPAWALVHDPANGHHALALVKEMERLGRQAKSKPGHAKDGFEELATRLGRAVPHFLPTFCEEVGRIFLAQGNQTYAATWFGKARNAERTYGLAVDEERLRAVFLEFALAGALTVKALREYVKELGTRLDPLTAWQRFRQLCAERSAAGMAPYAGVAEDARALIRAAGLDRAEHEQSLLAELLASPAVDRAPGAFWKTWHTAVIELARRDAAVRTRLLEIFPTPGGDNDHEQDTAWLAVLAESGAEELLTGPRAEGAEPAAGWLRQWTGHLGRGWRNRPASAPTLALAGRMIERLRTDGVPVDLLDGVRSSTTQLDLLDLLLTEGVPVADPAPGLGFQLGTWLNHATAASPALAAVAADERFRPALRTAVPGSWREIERTAGAAAVPALRELLVEWVDERTAELLAARGLAGAAALLKTLQPLRSAITAEHPAAAERIASLDVAALLGRALRAGIPDELGWPALEEALRRLGVKESKAPGNKGRPDDLVVEDAWPGLVLALGGKALVVGPQEILLEHDLRHPELDKWRRPRLRYVDGELLVAWHEDGKQRAYWSHRPTEVFDLGGETIARYWGGNDEPDEPSLPLAGGGRTTGERPLHAGDTRMPAEHRILGDGTGHWLVHHGSKGTALVEYDPATGERGSATLPPRIAADPAPGRLDLNHSCLLPLQPGLEQSPLGTDGAAVGHWVRNDGGRLTATTADGRTAVLPAAGAHPDRYPVGPLGLPGEPGVLLTRGRRDELALALPDPTGDAAHDLTVELKPCRAGGLPAAGTALVPPLDHWHALRPRDEQGSQLLRALTDEQAAALIDAAWPVDAEEVPAERRRWLTVQGVRRLLAGSSARKKIPVKAVDRALPGLGHPLLLAGVAGLARFAADLLDSAARFVPQPEAERAAEPSKRRDTYRPEHGRDHELSRAVETALPGVTGFGSSSSGSGNWHHLNNLRAVTAVLADPPTADCAGWQTVGRIDLTGDLHGWIQLLGRLGTLAYAAVAPLTDDQDRATLGLLLDELTRGPLAGRGATLREAVLTEPVDTRKGHRRHASRKGEVWSCGDRTVVVLAHLREHGDTVYWQVADHDPSGVFGQVAHFGLDTDRSTEERLTPEWTARFTAGLREHGGYPAAPEAVAAFAEATGIGTTRATLLFDLPANLYRWYGNLLDAEQLKRYGIKNADANAARNWLREVGRDDLAAVRAALLPAEPEQLWTTGPDAAGAAEVWNDRIGRLLTVPAEQQAGVNGASIQFVEAVLNHQRTPWLSRTTVQRLRPHSSGEHELWADDPSALPGNGSFHGAVAALRWLAHHTPYESPLRAALPAAAAALRRRLADPELLLDYGFHWAAKEGRLAPLLRSHYGLPEEGGADADGLVRCGPALVLGPGSQGETTYLRPAGLTGADDPLLELLDGLSSSYWFTHERPALEAVLGGEVERLVAPAGAQPAEGWPQHPLLSAPGTVADAAKALGLGEDAAVLYLQLLALPDPTDRNTARWTGWKPARLKKARAELAATDLVLEAKRARAGRSLFLPGGWQEARTPGLPAETWKAGLYPLPTGMAVLPPLPAAELFARAWQRVTDGDAPGYEELRTGRRAKGARR